VTNRIPTGEATELDIEFADTRIALPDEEPVDWGPEFAETVPSELETECPRCYGRQLEPLGVLGSLSYCRCKSCGWTFPQYR
jgi:hypothetical protein